LIMSEQYSLVPMQQAVDNKLDRGKRVMLNMQEERISLNIVYFEQIHNIYTDNNVHNTNIICWKRIGSESWAYKGLLLIDLQCIKYGMTVYVTCLKYIWFYIVFKKLKSKLFLTFSYNVKQKLIQKMNENTRLHHLLYKIKEK
jgi:hypothetical protein